MTPLLPLGLTPDCTFGRGGSFSSRSLFISITTTLYVPILVLSSDSRGGYINIILCSIHSLTDALTRGTVLVVQKDSGYSSKYITISTVPYDKSILNYFIVSVSASRPLVCVILEK